MSRILLGYLLLLLVSPLAASPEIHEFQVGKNVKVLYVHAPELPMVDIAVNFNAGSEHDGDTPGLSLITHSLLSAGTNELDADQVAAKFEDVGARFNYDVQVDRSSVSLRSLVDPKLFNPALETFIDILSAPSFPDRDFARTQQQMLIGLRDEQQRPGAIVAKEFQRAVFPDHSYGQPQQGTVESITAMRREDLMEFHQRYFVQTNVSLAIVGDVEAVQARQIANRIVEALPVGMAASYAGKAADTKGVRLNIPFPSQQAHVRIGQLGIERGNPDYFALYVGNHILGGGGFTSRLVEEVRSKRGLSYSVYSYFIPYRQPGAFMLSLQTRVDQVQEAIAVSQQVLRDFIRNGPTAEELALSKQNITGGFPLRLDSNADILGYLSVIAYYDLPLDYLQTFNKHVNEVTIEDIQRAFKKHLNPDQLVTVIVGGEQQS